MKTGFLFFFSYLFLNPCQTSLAAGRRVSFDTGSCAGNMSPSPARPTITSYYRHLCTAVKIRGALGRFIEAARWKGSLFYGAAEHQARLQKLASSPRFLKTPVLIKNHAFLSSFLSSRCQNPSITPFNPGTLVRNRSFHTLQGALLHPLAC